MQHTCYPFEFKNPKFKPFKTIVKQSKNKWFQFSNNSNQSHSFFTLRAAKNYYQTNSGRKRLFGAVIILFLLIQINSFAQCNSCIGAAACSGGNGVVSNGTNINGGQTYYYTSTGSLGSGINLNGGTLRICGNLTLSSINFNSGNIVIESGGTLTLNGGSTLYLNGNSRIYNRGTLNINRNVTMQNSNNLINNCISTSILNMNGSSRTLEINSSSSYFINFGTANIHTLFLQSTAPTAGVCLGAGSSMQLTNLNNNRVNGINAPSGNACIRYTNNAALNSNLTSTANVIICRAGGATTSGGAGFGSASVNVNCSSCLTALPVSLLDYTAHCMGDEIIVEWKVSNESNNKYFTLEKSYDAINWIGVKEIETKSNTSSINVYSVSISNENNNILYRLKQTDRNGTVTQFEPITASTCIGDNKLYSVYPNPSNKQINIVLKSDLQQFHFVLYNALQEIVFESFEKVEIIDTENLPSGIYFLKVNNQASKIAIEH